MKKLLTSALLSASLCVGSASSFAQSDSKELQTIYITAPSKLEEDKKTVATSVTVITEDEIESSGQVSVSELLRQTPSVNVSQTGGIGSQTTLRIRGEEGFRTQVYIDGIKSVDPTSVQVAPRLEHILVNGIERIEVLRGVQGFVYGADAGGVINIITKQGRGDLQAELSQSRGSFDSVSTGLNLSAGTDELDVFLSVNDIETEGFNARVNDLSKDRDGYENTTFHGKVGINFDENSRIELISQRILADTEFDSCFAADFSQTNDCATEFSQKIQKFSGETDFYSIEHSVAFTNTELSRDNFSNGSFGFDFEGEIERIEYNGNYIREDFSVNFGADSEEQLSQSTFSALTDSSSVGQYIEYKDSHIENLFINIGLRKDRSNQFEDHTSRRLAIAYLFPVGKHEIKLRASNGSGFRAPSLSEIGTNSSGGGDVLSEEDTSGSDWGIDWYTPNGTSVELTYFNQIVENEIVFNNNSFIYEQFTGESESKGVEIAALVPLNDHFSFVGNYTFNRTKDNEGEQRVRRPKYLGNIGLRYFGEKMSSSIVFRGAKDAVDINNTELDNYVVANLGLSYRWDNKISVFGSVNNVFDRDYEEVNGFVTPERNFNVSTKITF